MWSLCVFHSVTRATRWSADKKITCHRHVQKGSDDHRARYLSRSISQPDINCKTLVKEEPHLLFAIPIFTSPKACLIIDYLNYFYKRVSQRVCRYFARDLSLFHSDSLKNIVSRLPMSKISKRISSFSCSPRLFGEVKPIRRSVCGTSPRSVFGSLPWNALRGICNLR